MLCDLHLRFLDLRMSLVIVLTLICLVITEKKLEFALVFSLI